MRVGWSHRRTRDVLSVLLNCILCITTVRSAAVMYENTSGNLIGMLLTDPLAEGKGRTDIHLIKLPHQPDEIRAQALSSSRVHLHWSPGGEKAMASSSSFSIEERGESPERTRSNEAYRESLKPTKNGTFCVRFRQVATEPKIILESKSTCVTNVFGLQPKLVKPVFIAFVEILAASLVVSVIICIFVHSGLERLEAFLIKLEGESSIQGPHLEESLKGWLREDEDEKEPDERSHIFTDTNEATSV